MDRSSFLKSLFMVVVAPKMLAELNFEGNIKPYGFKSFVVEDCSIVWYKPVKIFIDPYYQNPIRINDNGDIEMFVHETWEKI